MENIKYYDLTLSQDVMYFCFKILAKEECSKYRSGFMDRRRN